MKDNTSQYKVQTYRTFRRRALVGGTALALFSGSALFAADSSWIGLGGGNWSNAALWASSTVPGATGTTNNTDTATFDTALNTVSPTITVDAGRNIKNITINLTNSTSRTYTLSGGSLVLSAGGALVSQGSGPGQLTLSTPSTLQGNYTFTADANFRADGFSAAPTVTTANDLGAVTLNLNGTWAGGSALSTGIISQGTNSTLSIVKSGSGAWQLNGVNTYSGGLSIKAGFFGAGNSGAAGSGTITLGDTTIGSNNASIGVGSNVNVANAITVASGSSGTLSFTRTGGSNSGTFSGPITLANNLTISQNANNTHAFNISGSIGGTGNVSIKPLQGTGATTLSNTSINFTGLLSNDGITSSATAITGIIGANVTGVTQNSSTSTLTLSNANTYTGPTTVNAGMLIVSGTGSIANTSRVIVAAGATFSKTSSVSLSTAFTLTEGATVSGSGISATSVNVAGNLSNGFTTIASSFAQGGTLRFDLTNPAIGTYSIFSGSSGSFSGVSIGATSLSGSGVFSGGVGDFIYTFTDATDSLVISAIPEPSSAAALAGLVAVASIATRRRRRA